MKRTLLLALAILFVGTAANAGYPYVGLYAGVYNADYVEGPGGFDHSTGVVSVPAPYTDIEMWIWWVPDPAPGKGLASVEFKIVYPTLEYVIQGAVTSNPLILAELGSLPVGIASTVGLLQCQYDWFWSHHQTLTLKKTTPSGTVEIVPDDGLWSPGTILVSDCNLLDHVPTKISSLWLNWNPFAVEEKTWGAIKSLYSD